MKVERCFKFNDYLYVVPEVEHSLCDLIIKKRGGKKSVLFEKCKFDERDCYKINFKLLPGKGYYNIFAVVDGIEQRIGKNLYQSVTNNRDRILVRGKYREDSDCPYLYITCYLTFSGSGLSVHLSLDKDYKKTLLAFRDSPTLLKVSKRGSKLVLKGYFQFLGDFEPRNVGVILKPRLLGTKFIVDGNKVKLKKSRKFECRWIFEIQVPLKEIIGSAFAENRFVDFYLYVVDVSGNTFRKKLGDPKKRIKVPNGESILHYSYLLSGREVYPYFARTDFRGLSLMYRDKTSGDKILPKLKEHIVLFLDNMFKSKRDGSWLLFEFESKTAQDNSAVFFDWLMKNHPEEKFYYIIDKKSPDFKRIQHYKARILKKYSFKHYYMLLKSSLLISSQSRFHSYKLRPLKSRMKEIILSKECVFLQHGVLGLKRVDMFRKKNSREAADSVVVSTRHEIDIVENDWGYNRDDIIDTGLTRFDLLEDKSGFFGESVLVIPTWRAWLESKSTLEFLETEFYEKYRDLLLALGALKDKNLKISFYLHSKMQPFLGCFKKLPNINIINPGDVSVNELLMTHSHMITDYSSVSWDFSYMDKPVIFYHFDKERFLSEHGSYIDFDNELFGNIALTPEDVVSSLDGGFSITGKSADFLYQDNNNCLRLYEYLKRRQASQVRT